jgi:putative hemolysin
MAQPLRSFLLELSQSSCGWNCVAFLLVCVVLHSFFELASVALVRARVSRVEELKEAGFSGALGALKILRNSDRYLLCCQFWSFLTAFTAGGVALALLLPTLTGAWLVDRSSEWPLVASILVYLLIPIVLISAAILLVQIAKSLAYAKPNRSLCYASFFLIPIKLASIWIVLFLHFLSGLLLRVLRLKQPEERDFAVSAAEINEIVERSSRAGTIEEDEHEMIKSVLEFSDTEASEIMTPRKDVIALPITASLQDLVDIFAREGHTRVLVFGRDLDDFKGIINAKDFVPLVGSEVADFRLAKYVRQIPAITGSLPIQQALSVMRKQSAHLAVVLDEHGGVDGILTVEDIIEQVVGDIFDEYDVPEDEQTVEETRPGELVFDGGALIDDINSEYGLNLPQGEYDTIAGFVITTLGKIPENGDEFEYQGLRFIVEDVSSNRINTVKVTSQAYSAKRAAI